MSRLWCLIGSFLVGNPVVAPDFQNLVQNKLKDLQMTITAGKIRLGELRKINNEFANAYRFKKMEVYYKEPSRMRLESEVLSRKLLYVINGDKKYIKAPGHQEVQDVAEAPGKKQTMLDFGLITPSVASRLKARFLREEKEGDRSLYLFELFWNYGDDHTRYLVWIDPQTKITVKRQWFNNEGKLMATFHYLEAVEVAPGLWIPTRVEVYNAENRFGGVTIHSNIQVNKGLDERLFKF